MSPAPTVETPSTRHGAGRCSRVVPWPREPVEPQPIRAVGHDQRRAVDRKSPAGFSWSCGASPRDRSSRLATSRLDLLSARQRLGRQASGSDLAAPRRPSMPRSQPWRMAPRSVQAAPQTPSASPALRPPPGRYRTAWARYPCVAVGATTAPPRPLEPELPSLARFAVAERGRRRRCAGDSTRAASARSSATPACASASGPARVTTPTRMPRGRGCPRDVQDRSRRGGGAIGEAVDGQPTDNEQIQGAGARLGQHRAIIGAWPASTSTSCTRAPPTC